MTTNKIKIIPEELYREGRIDSTLYFSGIESLEEGQAFALQAMETMAKEIGYTLVPADKKALTSRVKSEFIDKSAVPQAKLTQVVFSLLKEFSVKGASDE